MRRNVQHFRQFAKNVLDIRGPICAIIGSVMKKTYSTTRAAKLIGVHVVTLKRWLASRKIRPSIGTQMDGRTLWRFTDADVARFKRFKGTLKPGRKPGKHRKY